MLLSCTLTDLEEYRLMMVIIASQAASELLCLHTEESSKRLTEINSEKRVTKKKNKKREGKKG